MKTLIVEDDFTSRVLLQEILKHYGTAHVAVNGREAVEAVRSAIDARQPYDLICLDIMMPDMDGHEALKQIRPLYSAAGESRVRIVMTSALGDPGNVIKAYKELCDAYHVKPIDRANLLADLRKFGLIA